MIELSDEHLPRDLEFDDDYANYVTVLLGQVINCCLDENATLLEMSQWSHLHHSLEEWRACLPASFEPLTLASNFKPNHGLFHIWAVHGWHGTQRDLYKSTTDKVAAALQYYHTAMTILLLAKPQSQTAIGRIDQLASLTREIEDHATRLCALALTSECQSVWVNAFGPIAFCMP